MSDSQNALVPGCGQPIEISSVYEWNSILRLAYANNRTVIVDFHAEQSEPCETIAPFYSNLATQNPFTYFLRVDVGGNLTRAIAAKYSISTAPTFIVIKRPAGGDEKGKGEVVEILQGPDQDELAWITNTHASHAYAPPTELQSPEAEKVKEQGNDLFKKQQYAPAVDAYTKAIDLSPNSAFLYANRAVAYYRWIHSGGDGADSAESRMKLRAEQLKDCHKVTDMEERWGRSWVRLAEALLEAMVQFTYRPPALTPWERVTCCGNQWIPKSYIEDLYNPMEFCYFCTCIDPQNDAKNAFGGSMSLFSIHYSGSDTHGCMSPITAFLALVTSPRELHHSSDESMESVEKAKRPEGKLRTLQGAEVALLHAIDLSEGKVKTGAESYLDDVRKQLAVLS